MDIVQQYYIIHVVIVHIWDWKDHVIVMKLFVVSIVVLFHVVMIVVNLLLYVLMDHVNVLQIDHVVEIYVVFLNKLVI